MSYTWLERIRTFYGECECRKPEIRSTSKEHMRDNSISSALPLIEAECYKEDDANNKIGVYMWVRPLVSTTCPIEREKQKSGSNDDEEASDRIACPCPFLEGQSSRLAFLWPVQRGKAKGSKAVQGYLNPENVSPSGQADVGDCTCCETTDTVEGQK